LTHKTYASSIIYPQYAIPLQYTINILILRNIQDYDTRKHSMKQVIFLPCVHQVVNVGNFQKLGT